MSVMVIAVALLAGDVRAETEPSSSLSPRYEIEAAAEGLYFLDAFTGALWLKARQSDWVRVDSPVNQKPEAQLPASKPVSLVLPKAGVTMAMVQRERRNIPGSSNSLAVRLGDITAGQVFVEVIDANGEQVVDRTSLKNGEYVDFKVHGRNTYLQIIDMVNVLIGEDICKVHVSSIKPRKKSKKTAIQ